MFEQKNENIAFYEIYDASIYQIDIIFFNYSRSNIYLSFKIDLKVKKKDKHNGIQTWTHKKYICLHEAM